MQGGRARAEFEEEKDMEEIYFGDYTKEKSMKTLRLVSQNCNGIVKQNNFFTLQMEIENLNSSNYDVLFLQETNVNWNKRGIVRKTMKTLNKFKPLSISTATCQTFPKEATYQPGGTATIFRNTAAKYHTKIQSDPVGRWTIDRITINKKCIHTINIYRPSTDKNGNTSVWHQQVAHFQKQERNIINMRKQFTRDLEQEIKQLKEISPSIIMVGDLNEHIKSKEKTNEEIEKMGLLNVLEHRNSKQLPRTQKRGQQAIDHLWVTEDLLTSIINAGMIPFGSGVTSDHRPLFMDILLPQFYSTTNIRANNRLLHNNNPTKVEKYLGMLNNI